MNMKLTAVSTIIRGKRYFAFINLPTTTEKRCGNPDVKTQIDSDTYEAFLDRCAKMARGETYTFGG